MICIRAAPAAARARRCGDVVVRRSGCPASAPACGSPSVPWSSCRSRTRRRARASRRRHRERDAVDGVYTAPWGGADRAEHAARERIVDDEVLDLEDVAGPPRSSRGRQPLVEMARGHVAGSTSSSRGVTVGHGENARSQRGANGQPTSSRSRRGGAPGIEATASDPYRSGVAANSRRVYGCRGSWYRRSTGRARR